MRGVVLVWLVAICVIMSSAQPTIQQLTINIDRDEVCSLQRDPGPCREWIHRWFYNSVTRSCEKFFYGGCQGNANNFSTRRECIQVCQREVASLSCLPEGDKCIGNPVLIEFLSNAKQCCPGTSCCGCDSSGVRLFSYYSNFGKCYRNCVCPLD